MIVEQGNGQPLVLVPGIQGGWEFSREAVAALSAAFRVLTFPLADGRRGGPFDPALGLDNYTAQIADVLDSRGLDRAVICGISFGGLAALRFAARMPSRTAALVLASTPEPGWRLRPRHESYTRYPHVFGPLFLVESQFRLRREVFAALPGWMDRVRFVKRQIRTALAAPPSFARMAERGRMLSAIDPAADCAAVEAPTLVIRGEPQLDYVTPIGSRSRYADLIRGAKEVILERTGHLGSVTRPDAFASIVRQFVEQVHDAAA